MYRKPGVLTVSEWSRGYELWLKHGYTLEQVGRHLGLRPNSGRSVSTYLQRHFGEGATDPIANSFVRSLSEDYPDSKWVAELEAEDNRGSGRFMAVSVEKGIATKGVAKIVGNRSNEMKYRIEYQRSIHQSYDPWGQFDASHRPMLLPLFIAFVEAIVPILEVITRSENGLQLQSDVTACN